MKQGLINGTYHLQLYKEEMVDMKELIQLGLAIYREREPKSIYKDKVKRLENVVPKFTP